MVLIIESYFMPYNKIADVLFPKISFKYIDKPISESNNHQEYYYTRQDGSRNIKYYFDKIYYVADNKIVFIHKKMRKIKYYDLNTGKLIKFERDNENNKPKPDLIDKTNFLPQLKAQDGDLVLFPESDDEI